MIPSADFLNNDKTVGQPFKRLVWIDSDLLMAVEEQDSFVYLVGDEIFLIVIDSSLKFSIIIKIKSLVLNKKNNECKSNYLNLLEMQLIRLDSIGRPSILI